MNVISFEDKKPLIKQSGFIAHNATVIGDVVIGENSSVWFNAVIRGDVNGIVIGEETNIQDLCMLHADPEKLLTVGNRVTVGHACVLHGCTIEDDCLIGMGVIVMTGASIGRGSVVAAGSVVRAHSVIPPFSLAAGSPAKVVKTYEESRLEENRWAARYYVKLAGTYRNSA